MGEGKTGTNLAATEDYAATVELAVARALVTRPSVVFADEPTGSLDTIAGEQVMELLTAAATEQNTSVLLVTHEARVAAFAQREIVVRDGRVSGAAR